MKSTKKKNDFIDELSLTLPVKRIKRAHKEADKEILQIPKLNHHSIKERIFQSYIKGKLQKQ